MTNAIEVLKELQKEYVKCIDGVRIISPKYDALDEALLALEFRVVFFCLWLDRIVKEYVEKHLLKLQGVEKQK